MEHPKTLTDKYLCEVIKNREGIDVVLLRNPQGDTAQVCLHGGHLTSWRNDRGDELVFTTKVPRRSQAKRGGIAVCFPQFGTSAALETNGHVRKGWIIDENPPPLRPEDYEKKSFADLLLRPSPQDLKCWPYSYELRLRISLTWDGKMNMVSRIRNVDTKPFSFLFAYHTYLPVSDISEVRIEGLETLDYLDNLCERKRSTEQGGAVTFESEVDRAYLCTPKCLAVLDHVQKRAFVIKKDGLPDAVIWSAWDKKAKSIPDFEDAEYRKMVCVDGAVMENPVTLKPGQEWTGRLEIEVFNSSFCSEKIDSHLQHI